MEDEENVIDPVKTGKFIRLLRTAHGMSQTELGNKVFVTRKAVSKWETGKACPSIDILKKLCEEFGVTFEEMINGKFKGVNPYDKSKLGRIKKIIFSKRTKNFLIVFIGLCIYTLLVFFYENYNSTKVYDISYENENFLLVGGIYVTSYSSQYINLGNLTTYLTDVDKNTEFKLKLYTKIGDDKKANLLSYSYNGTVYYFKNSYYFSSKVNIEEEKGNIFLGISYQNIFGEKKTYELKLLMEINNSNKTMKNSTMYNKENILIKKNENTFNNNDKNVNQVNNIVNINFLYDLSNDKKLKYFNNRDIYINNEKYIIYYDLKENFIKISNDKEYFILFLERNVLLIYKTSINNSLNINIKNGKILFTKNEEKYFNIIKNIINELKGFSMST